MYSIFLLPNLSEYAKSGSLSISSSTHWGRGTLQDTKEEALEPLSPNRKVQDNPGHLNKCRKTS